MGREPTCHHLSLLPSNLSTCQVNNVHVAVLAQRCGRRWLRALQLAHTWRNRHVETDLAPRRDGWDVAWVTWLMLLSQIINHGYILYNLSYICLFG